MSGRAETRPSELWRWRVAVLDQHGAERFSEETTGRNGVEASDAFYRRHGDLLLLRQPDRAARVKWHLIYRGHPFYDSASPVPSLSETEEKP